MDLLEWVQRSATKEDQRATTPLLSGKAEGVGVAQPGEEKVAAFQHVKGSYKKVWDRFFPGFVVIGQRTTVLNQKGVDLDLM